VRERDGMATFTKFNQFVLDLGKGVHNFTTHTLKVVLTNTAPVATNAVLADLTQITAANGYTAGGTAVGSVTYTQTSGVATLVGADVVFTASGGSFGPSRYAVLYNDTPTSPADPLIGFWDRGSSVTTNDTETLTADFGASILTLT
jgi:hypothetical protein